MRRRQDALTTLFHGTPQERVNADVAELARVKGESIEAAQNDLGNLGISTTARTGAQEIKIDPQIDQAIAGAQAEKRSKLSGPGGSSFS